MTTTSQLVRQRGSALIISMVFLLILTILGISTMTTSRVEVRMAINQQSANKAFVAAASGIEETLTQSDIYGADSLAGGAVNTYYYSTDPAGPYTDGTDNFMEQVVTNNQFEIHGPLLNSDTGSGAAAGVTTNASSLGKFGSNHYRLLSTGNSVAGSESQQVQGFYKIGPALKKTPAGSQVDPT